jgi:hypothetical protein
MLVLEEVEVPAISRNFNDGLPDGYSITFDGFRNVHIPYWGELALNLDGFPMREHARENILHHSIQAARVSPRSPR